MVSQGHVLDLFASALDQVENGYPSLYIHATKCFFNSIKKLIHIKNVIFCSYPLAFNAIYVIRLGLQR